MTYTFNCAMHKEFGTLGWQGDMLDVFEPVEGMGVAHDILEHGYHKQANMAFEELMALGATQYTRANGLYWYKENPMQNRRGKHPFVHNVGSDLYSIMRYYLEHHNERLFFNHILQDTPSSHRLDQGDDIMAEGAEAMLDSILEELYDDDNKEFFVKNRDKLLRNILYCFRTGYRNAVHRYSAYMNDEEVCHMFIEIKNEANKYLKIAEEGDQLIVRMVITNQFLNVSIKQPYYYY